MSNNDDKLGVVNPKAAPPSTPPSTGEAAQPVGVGEIEPGSLKERIVEALKTVHDPEIPVNIYELGLIYELRIDEDANVSVLMTLTAPGCPVAGQIVEEVHSKVAATEGVNEANVELTWDPPWCMDYMSDAARLALNML